MADLQSSHLSPINTRTKACVDLFERLSVLSPQPGNKELHTTQSNDSFGRFRIWAGNIGALQLFQTKSSLDYRLRDVKKIAAQITGLLDDLAESLHDACSILSDEKVNRIEVVFERDFSGENAEDEDSTCDSGEEVLSEINEIFSSIAETIGSLFRFSIIIRNNTNRDRYAKATAAAFDQPIQDQYDINHVREKFPALATKGKEWFIERLGKAITQRRQYLKYCREHHQKVSTDRTPEKMQNAANILQPKFTLPGEKAYTIGGMTTLSKPTSTLAPTQASTLVLNSGENVEEDVPEEAQSQTSYATSLEEELSDSVLRIVKLEDVSKGMKYFECPYCWQIQAITTQRAWKNHVLKDLKPYVCTHEDCNSSLFSDRHTWFSHELKDHRREWLCHFCIKYKPFDSIDKYQAHLNGSHPEAFVPSQLQALLEISQRSSDQVSPSECPFCNNWEQRLRSINTHIPRSNALTVTTAQFKHHVGAHMEQLALFAVPRGYTEHGDVDSANAALGSDLDLLSPAEGTVSKLAGIDNNGGSQLQAGSVLDPSVTSSFDGDTASQILAHEWEHSPGDYRRRESANCHHCGFEWYQDEYKWWQDEHGPICPRCEENDTTTATTKTIISSGVIPARRGGKVKFHEFAEVVSLDIDSLDDTSSFLSSKIALCAKSSHSLDFLRDQLGSLEYDPVTILWDDELDYDSGVLATLIFDFIFMDARNQETGKSDLLSQKIRHTTSLNSNTPIIAVVASDPVITNVWRRRPDFFDALIDENRTVSESDDVMFRLRFSMDLLLRSVEKPSRDTIGEVFQFLKNMLEWWKSPAQFGSFNRHALERYVEIMTQRFSMTDETRRLIWRAKMHIDHEVLLHTYANKETLHGDLIADIPRESFLATDDNFAWDVKQLCQAIISNAGSMKNPITQNAFTEADTQAILDHPLSFQLKSTIRGLDHGQEGLPTFPIQAGSGAGAQNAIDATAIEAAAKMQQGLEEDERALSGTTAPLSVPIQYIKNASPTSQIEATSAATPVKSILRPPREKFPEYPHSDREGVAPLRDANKAGIPPEARWTKISRTLVSPAALEAGKERFEEEEDSLIVLRVLSREEAEGYAEVTERIRSAQEEQERGQEQRELQERYEIDSEERSNEGDYERNSE